MTILESKGLGLALAGIGLLLVVYEYWFSYCSPVSDICFFPLSPSEKSTIIPLYSAAVFVFGLLLHFGSGGGEKENGEAE